jgi:RHS repeat-associated protein
LGNVYLTLSGLKLGYDTTSDGRSDYYEAAIRSALDYYAFGMGIASRSYNEVDYRYGFNGKEDDVETGWQDYGMRIYNPQLSRFFSVDPITKQYPELTPYQFASNRPIDGIDLDGLEWSKSTKGSIVTFTVKLRVITGADVKMSRQQMVEKLKNIEAVAENNFYQSFSLDVLNKNGKGERAEYKLDIQFDLVEEDVDRKFTGTGDFTVTLHNNMMESAFSSVEGEVKTIGDTKVNNIDLAIGDIMIEGNKQFGIPEFKRDNLDIAKTFLHELGHTAGLLHTGYKGKAGYLPNELKGVKNAMDYRAMKISSKYLFGASNIMIQGNRQDKQQFNILQYMHMESNVEESKKVGP